MDALSVAASIIAVVQISAQIVRTCTKYIDDVWEAPKELHHILVEILTLKGFFESLKAIANDHMTALDMQLAKPVDGCAKALAELNALLDEAEADAGNNDMPDEHDDEVNRHRRKRRKTASILVRLAWPLKKDKAKRLLDLIGVYKGTITLILSAHGV